MTEGYEEHVIEKCRICSRLEIEGHSSQKMADEMRSHAKWLIEQRMTSVAMQVKDAAAMLEHLANDRATVQKFLDTFATQQQYEVLMEDLEEKIDKLRDPIERGADSVSRVMVGAIAQYIEEGGETNDDLLCAIGGCLVEHIQAKKDKAAPDVKHLFDLCEERTKHLNDEEEM